LDNCNFKEGKTGSTSGICIKIVIVVVFFEKKRPRQSHDSHVKSRGQGK